MKRLIIALMCVMPTLAYAQISSSVGVYGKRGEIKVITESTTIGDRYTGYAYTETSTARSWYGQFFWEQKYWDAPIFLHAEYRGTMAGDWYESTTYIGAAYCYYNNAGFVAIEPLLMWKQECGVGGQLSIVGEWNWKYFQIQHYTDIWRTQKMQSPVDAYIEARAYFKATKRLSLGVIGTSYYTKGIEPNRSLYLAAKINL